MSVRAESRTKQNVFTMTLKYLYVYILKCADNTFYTGVTNNLERRLSEHNSAHNKDSYTASRLPATLVYQEIFTDYNLAIAWEKKIKSWSIKKKEALINSDWKSLKVASVCRNETHFKHFSTPLEVTVEKNNL